MKQPSKFVRRAPTRKTNDVVYVITEGQNTEPSYLENIKSQLKNKLNAHIKIESAKHSSISYLLKKAKTYEPEEEDELWIVLDRDEGFHNALGYKELAEWEQESEQHHVALSNPRFEYWLLLHFEENPSPSDAKRESYLEEKGYIPGYVKNGKKISGNFLIPLDRVCLATKRAEASDFPTPQHPGTIGSGMHPLMRSIFSHTFVGITSPVSERISRAKN